MLFGVEGKELVVEVTVKDGSDVGQVEVREGDKGAFDIPMQIGLCRINFLKNLPG